MSFLRSYEREMAQYTDAPAVFHTAAAYALLGAALTSGEHRCQLAGGVPIKWLNLWVFLIGDAGNSRKSTAVNMADEVLARSIPQMRAPNDGSPEGFAKDFCVKDLQGTPGSGGNAASIMVSSEMGALLMNMQKDYMKPMKGMFMDFFDVPAVYKRKLSKEEFTVRRPRFSMLGAVATELLPNLSSAEDWLGGFMSRALLIPAKRTRTLDRAGTPPEKVYIDLAAELTATLAAWKRTRIRARKAMPRKKTKAERKAKTFLFDYDDAAMKEVRRLKGTLEQSFNQQVDILRSRADSHLMKMAAIEQVSMDPTSTVITKAAVTAAWPLFSYWWERAPGIMEVCFARSNNDMEGDRLARRLLRVVHEAGDLGISEQEAMRQTVLSREHFQKAVASLQFAQHIEATDPGDGGLTRLRALGKLKDFRDGPSAPVLTLPKRTRAKRAAGNPMSLSGTESPSEGSPDA